MSQEYKYRIVEEKEIPDESVIEKTGGVVKFTLAEIKAGLASLNKMKEELEAGIKLRDAEMKNIEGHHPEVLDADEKNVFTAQTLAFYTEKKKDKVKYEKKLKLVEEAIAEDSQAIKDIGSQVGIVINLDELNDKK